MSKLLNILNPNEIEAVEWLRFVLCQKDDPPFITDWRNVYFFCDKQKIGGVCEPTRFDVHVDDDTLLDWMAFVRQLAKSNSLLNERVCQLFQLLEKDGFRCCLLKGQGNAEMYPDPSLRIPGDIDVWIDADEKNIYEYVLEKFPDAKTNFKHIKFPIFSDIPVDVHQTPLKFKRSVSQRRLQKWIQENKEVQFSNTIKLTNTDVEIAVPTAQFNAVYQLGHIKIHLFDEGVGLRHLVDYFYVLKNLKDASLAEKEQIRMAWKQLGMTRLAAAIMWIEHEILGLSEDLLLTDPNKRWGKIILDDILEGGNFGKYSQQLTNVGRGRVNKRMRTFKRLISLFPCFPDEMVFRLISRTKTMMSRDLKKVIH